jgi:hypothetical protein
MKSDKYIDRINNQKPERNWLIFIIIILLIFSFLIGRITAAKVDNNPSQIDVVEYIYYVCRYYPEKQLNTKLITSIIAHESKWNPDAVGRDGETGFMQLMVPAIKDTIKNNPTRCSNWSISEVQGDWRKNIWSGINYMNQQIINADGDIKEALRMYNQGASSTYTNYTYAETVLGIMSNTDFKVYSENLIVFLSDYTNKL